METCMCVDAAPNGGITNFSESSFIVISLLLVLFSVISGLMLSSSSSALEELILTSAIDSSPCVKTIGLGNTTKTNSGEGIEIQLVESIIQEDGILIRSIPSA